MVTITLASLASFKIEPRLYLTAMFVFSGAKSLKNSKEQDFITVCFISFFEQIFGCLNNVICKTIQLGKIWA